MERARKLAAVPCIAAQMTAKYGHVEAGKGVNWSAIAWQKRDARAWFSDPGFETLGNLADVG
jgi:hypothetical protein